MLLYNFFSICKCWRQEGENEWLALMLVMEEKTCRRKEALQRDDDDARDEQTSGGVGGWVSDQRPRWWTDGEIGAPTKRKYCPRQISYCHSQLHGLTYQPKMSQNQNHTSQLCRWSVSWKRDKVTFLVCKKDISEYLLSPWSSLSLHHGF